MEGSVGVGGTCGWGQLVLVIGVNSKCLLIPGLSVWTLVWVGSVRCWCGLLVWAVCGLLLAWALVWVVGVGCWRGVSKLRRCDHHPCEVLQCNQCLDLQEVDLRKE